MCISSGTSWFSLAEPAAFPAPSGGSGTGAGERNSLADRTVRLRSSPARSALGENRRGEKRSIWRKGLWGAARVISRASLSLRMPANRGWRNSVIRGPFQKIDPDYKEGIQPAVQIHFRRGEPVSPAPFIRFRLGY